MTKNETIAIYRKAYNDGRLTLRELEAFLHAIDANYATTPDAKAHALAHLAK